MDAKKKAAFWAMEIFWKDEFDSCYKVEMNVLWGWRWSTAALKLAADWKYTIEID